MENERFSVEEINEYLYSLDGSGKCGDCKYEIARFVDAKSYAIGKQEGRTEAAREIFEELKKYDATLRMGTAADGYFHYEYRRLSELLKDFKSHYGVTE